MLLCETKYVLPAALEAIKDRRVWGVIVTVAPLIFGAFVYKSDVLVGRILAGMLPTGEISWISYAQRMSMFLVSVTAAGATTVVFPSLAGHGARGDKDSISKDTVMVFRYIAMFSGAVLIAVFGARTRPRSASSPTRGFWSEGHYSHWACLGCIQWVCLRRCFSNCLL